MAEFLLIHGASHGAWCWDRVIPVLADLGHTAKAIDLPGHGADTTPRSEVSMADYVDRVEANMSPGIVLVGHSFGGFPITLAASRAPETPRALVYLCALLPRPGQAFSAFRADAISPAVSEAQTVDRTEGVATVIAEKAGAVFYSDCSEEDRAWALPRLTPQPISVMTETVDFTPPSTERHYIRCLQDRVVFPRFQRATSEDWQHTHDMNAGHSPFLSDPKGLASLLDRIAST